MALQHIQTPPVLRNIVGCIILLGAIAVVVFSGASSITHENIDQHLQRFATYVSQTASGHGKQGKFTYGNIDILGFGHNKEATIDHVTLGLSEPAVLDTTTWLISTDSMRVVPDFSMPGRLVFVLAEPINVIKNSQLKTTITASEPFRYGYYEGVYNGKNMVMHNLHLPDQVVFTPGRAVGETANDIGPVVVTYDANPVAQAKFMPDENKREINYQFHNIQILASAAGLNIGSLTGKYVENFSGDRLEGNYDVEVDDFSIGKEKRPGPGYSLQTSINYHGDKPDFDLMAMHPSLGSNAELTFEQALLTGADFQLTATGKLATAQDDPLPFGDIQLHVDHAGKFLASDLVPDQFRSPLTAALEKITGQPVTDDTQLSIPLKREKGGVFYIGDTTFEQLTASLIKDAFKQGTAPAAPVLPPPAASPLPTIDKGT